MSETLDPQDYEELDEDLELGELFDTGDEDSPVSNTNHDSIILDTHSHSFPNHEGTLGEMLDKVKCRVCAKRTPSAVTVDGMCFSCALKKMRTIEETLVRFKKVKEPHKWCIVEGHGLAATPIKGLEDWYGVITVNGVNLYTTVPLCQHCLDLITTQQVAYLEERGILRKGNNHENNEFGTPYKAKLSVAQREEAIIRLKDYIAALEVLVNSKDSPLSTLHKQLTSARAILLKQHMKKNAPKQLPEAPGEEKTD